MRLSDRLAEALLGLVRDRGLKPGDRLPSERRLAQDLAASRSSIREAIHQLASQGVLYSRQGGGTFLQAPADFASTWPRRQIGGLRDLLVADPDYRYDVLEARHALEGGTAWHAALRATPDDIARIQTCFDDLQRFQDEADANLSAEADARFHLAIAEASHNAVLIQMMRGLFDLLRSTVTESRQRMYTMPDTQGQLLRQHRAIKDAIAQGDASGARAAIWQHLQFIHAAMRQLDEDEARQARSSRLIHFP
ncbi:transcriptional regulator LldR [Castellaniella sp.]|uniref:transcriptional regulator LldR n=1 Tax=Castellaniella sp. TaxID=1955812 RepID=UPI003A90E559